MSAETLFQQTFKQYRRRDDLPCLDIRSPDSREHCMMFKSITFRIASPSFSSSSTDRNRQYRCSCATPTCFIFRRPGSEHRVDGLSNSIASRTPRDQRVGLDVPFYKNWPILLVARLLTEEGQRTLISRCLGEYLDVRNVCNLDAHHENVHGRTGRLWQRAHRSSSSTDSPNNDHGDEIPFNERDDARDEVVGKQLLQKLRWVTLGFGLFSL